MILKKATNVSIPFFLLLFLLLPAGCAIRPSVPPMVTFEGLEGHFFTGQIVRPETGEVVDFDRFVGDLGKSDLVFIGEVHDNPEHHLLQVQILQALMKRKGSLTVAMEFFEETQQPVLDQYMRGDLPEKEFLRLVEWKRSRGVDYSYYRPLVLMSKHRARRLLGINAPREIVKKVARSGLNSLDARERSLLASTIDLDREEHRSYLKDVYKRHSHRHLKDFEFFYQAQCVWEDTMAENIAEYMAKKRGKMVVFAGKGHIINRFGIPDRTIKRNPVTMVTVVLYPVSERAEINKGIADYVWLTGNCSPRN